MDKKRFFGAFLIIMALIVMLLPAAEADAETSASVFSIKSGELIKYNGSDKIVSVPETVTSIGGSAFENNTVVEKIILPDSVEKIDAYAFWGCDHLKTVILGKKISEIGDFAFTNCDGLETMTIPSNVRRIGIQAFADCDRFEDITIPPEVTDIREDAFDGDYLLNIHCETGSYADKYAQNFYERQKDMAVYDKSSSGNSDESPDKPLNPSADGVYSGADIQSSQEEENKELYEPSGEVMGSTKVVGNQAVVLMQSTGLPVLGHGEESPSGKQENGDTEASQTATEQEESRKISERSHYRDEDLTEATVAEGVREIGRFAYARSGLTEISLPEGLESIEFAAFYHCDDLAAVELPESVNSVEAKAFDHTAWVDNFMSGRDGTEGDFLISGGVLIAYRGNAEEVVIPEGVRVIAGEAFADHSEIRKICFPLSLQFWAEDAFVGCSPQEMEYGGETEPEKILEKLMEQLMEEQVIVDSLDAAPKTAERSLPFTWIFAAILFAGGCVCMLRRAG